MEYKPLLIRLLEEDYDWLDRHSFETKLSKAEIIRQGLDLYREREANRMTTLHWQVIEDDGGGLHLAVFDGGKVVYYSSGQEIHGTLLDDLAALRQGDDTSGWEQQTDDPQAAYDELTSYESGWTVIADQDGVYVDRMGAAGLKALGIHSTIIYATDESTVERVPGGYRWTWFEPEEGSEFVPEAGAAEHFEQSGREDIAELIRSGAKYIYGRRS